MSVNILILTLHCGYGEENPCLSEKCTEVFNIMGYQFGNIFKNDSEGKKPFVLFLQFSMSMKSFQN